jgi:hypothetical protein
LLGGDRESDRPLLIRGAEQSMKTSDQNASSLALYIGKTGVLRREYLTVDVTIVDAKRSYGHALIGASGSGSGEQWVEESRVTGIED